MQLKKNLGILLPGKAYSVVSIGTDKMPVHPKKIDPSKVIFGFIGVLKRSQGVGIVFDNATEIIKIFPKSRYEIIGSGPDEEFYEKLSKDSPIPAHFYGYLEGDSYNNVLKKCDIGIATYVPVESNVSAYGDPGKVKRYLTLGIPVIATGIFEFAETLQKRKAGIIIDYNNKKEFINAVKEIMSNYKEYSENALKLSSRFYYKDIYPSMFTPHHNVPFVRKRVNKEL